MTKALTLAMESDEDSKRLVEIACKHTKLALEAVRKGTTPERREQIRRQIEQLRLARERILFMYKMKANNECIQQAIDELSKPY